MYTYGSKLRFKPRAFQGFSASVPEGVFVRPNTVIEKLQEPFDEGNADVDRSRDRHRLPHPHCDTQFRNDVVHTTTGQPSTAHTTRQADKHRRLGGRYDLAADIDPGGEACQRGLRKGTGSFLRPALASDLQPSLADLQILKIETGHLTATQPARCSTGNGGSVST
jgi:hypothetical protein